MGGIVEHDAAGTHDNLNESNPGQQLEFLRIDSQHPLDNAERQDRLKERVLCFLDPREAVVHFKFLFNQKREQVMLPLQMPVSFLQVLNLHGRWTATERNPWL